MRAADRPFASRIGHGALGLRSNLRPLSDLLAETRAQRHVHLELRGGLTLSGWRPDGESWFARVPGALWDGLQREVVGVRVGPRLDMPSAMPTYLSRVETHALCKATPGSCYYLPAGQAIPWDLGATTWDGGATTWDTEARLFVHLAGNEDPRTRVVIAQLGFYFASAGSWQPLLGLDKLIDGGIELWTDSTTPTHWTKTLPGGGVTVNQDASFVLSRNSASSARFEGLIAATSLASLAQAGMPGVAGAIYRYSGYYCTESDLPPDLTPRIRAGFAGAYLLSDGFSTTSATTGIALTPTLGMARRFLFEFVCPADTSALSALVGVYNASGGTLGGKVWVDGLRLQRVYRYEYAEPRVLSMPSIESARENDDMFWAPLSTGIGSLVLANDGALDAFLAEYDFVGQEVTLYVGGRFPDGDEITLEDMGIPRVPRVANVVLRDHQADLALEDEASIFRRPLPTRSTDAAMFPNAAERDQGRPWPLSFGAPLNIRPAQLGLATTNGCGAYSIADPIDFIQFNDADPNRYYDPSWVYPLLDTDGTAHLVSYEDEEAARQMDSTRRVVLRYSDLDPYVAYDWELFNEHSPFFFIMRDVRPRRIDASNDALDFNIGWRVVANVNDRIDFTRASALTATIAAGTYATPAAYAAAVIAALEAADATPVWACSYNSGTGIFTVSSDLAFVLQWHSGANAGQSARDDLGFRDVDTISATSHVGAAPVYCSLTPGSTLVARVPHGLYAPGEGSASSLADALASAMNAAAGTADIDVVLERIANKIVISRGSGALQLLCKSGPTRDVAMWSVLGFKTDADRTAALSYTGDESLFESPDRHVLRVEREVKRTFGGILQPTSVSIMDGEGGKYTGSGGGRIDKAPDIARFLLTRILGQPDESIDASFIAARTWASAYLYCYIGNPTEPQLQAGEVLSRIQASAGADIILDGGRWYFKQHSSAVPADIVDVGDADLLDDFSSWKAAQDDVGCVKVAYDQNATTGEEAKVEKYDQAIRARFPNARERTWRTYCWNSDVATARLNAIAAEAFAAADKRRFHVMVKGKALLLPVGGKIRLTRSRGLSTTGALTNVLCVILHKVDRWDEWTSDLTLKEI